MPNAQGMVHMHNATKTTMGVYIFAKESTICIGVNKDECHLQEATIGVVTSKSKNTPSQFHCGLIEPLRRDELA